MPPPQGPVWNNETHTLFWRGDTVHHFTQEAPFEEAILRAFEKRGWPEYIDASAVFPSPSGGRVGGNTKRRLRDTIGNLNRNVRPCLRFHQERSGAVIRWRGYGITTETVRKKSSLTAKGPKRKRKGKRE
ncbi:MAG: hypothetical protein L0Y72_23970 [Gemmataceae bacterium]|nr:hypothetical protein [Gemmataceae bacterium]